MMPATVRSVEPDSGGADVFLEKKVSHAVVKLAMALRSQPGKYLQTAPGDTTLYKGEGLGLAQYIGQRPLEDRSLLPLVTIDSLRASLALADGGAVLAPERRGVLVQPPAEALPDVRASEPAAAGKGHKKEKEKKEKRAKEKKEKDKKEKKEKRSKEKSKDKEKSSGKRKRSEEKD